MKHKAEEYHLFTVTMSGWFGFHLVLLQTGIVKPSFKTAGSYSTVVALSMISGIFMVHSVIAKLELVDVVNMLLHSLYNILDYVELELAIIPEDKTCTDTPQQWNRPRNIPSDGPILFSEI